MFNEGYADAWAFWGMCPAEIKGRIEALNVNRRRELEARDQLAWMTGMYLRVKNYPHKPNVVKEKPKDMTDDEMKSAMGAIAKKQGEQNADNS